MSSFAPILITGTHRSGTTWVGKMLAASPEVAYIQEPMNPEHRRGECRADFGTWFPMLDSESGARYVNDLRDCLVYRYHLLAACRNAQGFKPWLRIPYDLGRCYFNRCLGKRPLIKDPIALLSAEWLAEEFAMDVVVMIRHPAAFVGSLKRAGWNFPFGDLMRQGVCNQGPLMRFQHEVEWHARERRDIISQGILLWNLFHTVICGFQMRHPDWVFLRHEDLSTDPLREFENLCVALGLNCSDSIRQKIESSTRAASGGDANLHSVYRDSRQNVYSWRSRLEEDEIRQVREGTAEIAAHFYGDMDWRGSSL
jgi:hypothetical protein